MKKLQLGNSAGYDTARGWKTRFHLIFERIHKKFPVTEVTKQSGAEQ